MYFITALHLTFLYRNEGLWVEYYANDSVIKQTADKCEIIAEKTKHLTLMTISLKKLIFEV